MNNRNELLVLLIVGALLAVPVSAADKKNSRERELQRRVQQMQGQVSTLEQEKAGLSQELDAAGKALQSAKDAAAKLGRESKAERLKREGLEKELVQSREELASVRGKLAQTETSLAETAGTLKETRQTLAATEAAKKNLETIKAHKEREITLCEDKNGKLYKYGRELMVRYERKSCTDAMAQKEPFTGLKQVEIENLLEEYRDKLDAEKIIKAPGG